MLGKVVGIVLVVGALPAVVVASEKRLSKEVTVSTTIARVWEVWTTSDGIASFFAPESKIGVRPGDPYELYMGATEPDQFGKRGTQGCKLLSVIPKEMISFEWSFPPSVPALRASGAKTHVVLRFDDLGPNGVRVRFDQLGWQDGADWDAGYAYFDRAWSGVLDNLKRTLSGATARAVQAPASSKTWVDGQVKVTSVSQPQRYQAFEVVLPASTDAVWQLLASEAGFKQLGAKDPILELKPWGRYSFWPAASNKVLSYVPQEMLSTTGSAPPEFPTVRRDGTWSSYFLESVGESHTKLRLVSVGWKEGDEWQRAFDYFLKNNAVFLNHVYTTLATQTNDSTKLLTHEFIVHASQAEVWHAFTTEQGMRSWLVPHAEVDLRVGGKIRTNYRPDGALGDEHTIEQEILSIDPLHMLSTRVSKVPAGFAFPNAAQSTWSVVYFEPVDSFRTRVIMRGLGYQRDSESQQMRAYFEKGNDWHIQRLNQVFPPF